MHQTDLLDSEPQRFVMQPRSELVRRTDPLVFSVPPSAEVPHFLPQPEIVPLGFEPLGLQVPLGFGLKHQTEMPPAVVQMPVPPPD